jgi:hypothetical protein
MASAQVFEDVGRMMFGAADQLKKRSRKRAKPKRSSARKKPTARPRRRARKS